MRLRRQTAATLAVTLGMASALTTSLAVASAAPSSATVDDLVYAFDPDDVAAGATAIGAAAPTATVTVPATITVDGTAYAVTGIGDEAFDDAAVTAVTIGDQVVTIGASAFEGNQLASISIPSSVREIGAQAFAFNALTTATLADGVERIDTLAFYANQLQAVTLPATVSSIGFYALGENPLSTVSMQGSPPSTSGTITAWPQPTVEFPWRFGEERTAGGYTEPTWNDMPSVAFATIAFDAAGGSAVAPQQVRVDGTSTATRPLTPTRAGFAFVGWTTDGASGYDFSTPVDGDRTLIARWVELPAIAGPATAIATVGEPFNYAPTITGAAPLAISLDGRLPIGLTFDPDTGAINGTPIDTASGYTLSYTVENDAGTATHTVSVELRAGAATTFTATLDPAPATAGTPSSITIQAFDAAGNSVAVPATVVVRTNDSADRVADGFVTFARAGLHTLTIIDPSSGTSSTIDADVLAAAVAAPPSATPIPSPTLPQTGSTHSSTTLIAGAATALAGLLLMAIRRHRA